MALLQALLALITRSAGKILNAIAERRPAVLDESGPLRRHGRAFAAAAAVVLAGTALAVFWRWRRPKALVSRVARTMRRKGARLTLLGGDRS